MSLHDTHIWVMPLLQPKIGLHIDTLLEVDTVPSKTHFKFGAHMSNLLETV